MDLVSDLADRGASSAPLDGSGGGESAGGKAEESEGLHLGDSWWRRGGV